MSFEVGILNGGTEGLDWPKDILGFPFNILPSLTARALRHCNRATNPPPYRCKSHSDTYKITNQETKS